MPRATGLSPPVPSPLVLRPAGPALGGLGALGPGGLRGMPDGEARSPGPGGRLLGVRRGEPRSTLLSSQDSGVLPLCVWGETLPGKHLLVQLKPAFTLGARPGSGLGRRPPRCPAGRSRPLASASRLGPGERAGPEAAAAEDHREGGAEATYPALRTGSAAAGPGPAYVEPLLRSGPLSCPLSGPLSGGARAFSVDDPSLTGWWVLEAGSQGGGGGVRSRPQASAGN